MGVMILAEGFSPCVEFQSWEFSDFQILLVKKLYGDRGLYLYRNYSKLDKVEIAEWKKLSNNILNKFLLIENKLELSTAQIKKLIDLFENVPLAECSNDVFKYLRDCMYHCIEHKVKMVLIKR